MYEAIRINESIYSNNFGLVGKGITHSFSKELHKYFGDYKYNLYDLSEYEMKNFILSKEYKGLNITMPYKRTVYSMCDIISPEAKMIGSVNTVVNRDGKLYGYNTDFFGFKNMLIYNGIKLKDKKVMILGTGGASLTVQSAVKSMGAKSIVVISRKGDNNYGNILNHKDSNIIINTTPIGMYPNIEGELIDISKFEICESVIDIIYNPLRTRLLVNSELCGKKSLNGLMMLILQGMEASKLFRNNDVKIPLNEIISKIEGKKRNLVLIGMPSCGKSTLGYLISKELNMDFIDIDERIYNIYNKKPEQIISEYGEKKFRDIEKGVISDLSKMNGIVISTGGGAVLNEENMVNLMMNGKVIHIERSINLLDNNCLPAIRAGGIDKLYAKRKRLYEKYRELAFKNNSSINKVKDEIIDVVKRL